MGIIDNMLDKATGFVTTDVDINKMIQMIKELFVDPSTDPNELVELEKMFGFHLLDKPLFTKDGKYKLAVMFGQAVSVFNMDMKNVVLLIDIEKKICYQWHSKSANQIKSEVKVMIRTAK